MQTPVLPAARNGLISRGVRAPYGPYNPLENCQPRQFLQGVVVPSGQKTRKCALTGSPPKLRARGSGPCGESLSPLPARPPSSVPTKPAQGERQGSAELRDLCLRRLVFSPFSGERAAARAGLHQFRRTWTSPEPVLLVLSKTACSLSLSDYRAGWLATDAEIGRDDRDRPATVHAGR